MSTPPRQCNENTPVLIVAKEELTGIDNDWINDQENDSEGRVLIPCNLVTQAMILTHCANGKVRKAIYEKINNRGYPQNEAVIVQLAAKRNELARLLGFSSYAEYELSSLMIASPSKAKEFLSQIKPKINARVDFEFNKLMQELPEGVQLTSQGQLERYDEFFVYNCYVKNHYSVDSNKISEYFPLEATLKKLLQIYETFFNLSIVEVSHSIPIPQLKALEVRSLSQELLGFILLDLFPREGKCSHFGVCWSLINAFSLLNGQTYPAVAVVTCNMTKPLADRPSLLTHKEMMLFFHECGHAIHHILGRTQFFGPNIKTDFVEVPSILLEQWMWDANILKEVSGHYVTHESLPDTLIHNLICSKDFGRAYIAQRNVFMSELSLELFSQEDLNDPSALAEEIWTKELAHTAYPQGTHFHNSWWHISCYGSKYYSYLHSEAYAQDFFKKIRQHGLKSGTAGAEYVAKVLSKAGSIDPYEIVHDYLGRPLNLSPFLEQFSLPSTD